MLVDWRDSQLPISIANLILMVETGRICGQGAYQFVACLRHLTILRARGGVLICCLPLSHLAIDRAPLSRRSSVPTPNRDAFNISVLIMFCCPYITWIFFLLLSYPLPVWPFFCNAHHLYPRIAIVFSLLSTI